MSIGQGKVWRRWRNVGGIMGKRYSSEEELRDRFGQGKRTMPPVKSKPFVSDDEVRAAKLTLEKFAKAANRDQPLPDTIIRFALEEAAMVRTGKKRLPPLPKEPFPATPREG